MKNLLLKIRKEDCTFEYGNTLLLCANFQIYVFKRKP